LNNLFIYLFTFFLVSASLLGQISYKEVEAQGLGEDLGEAVTNALAEAVGMVNGRSIESESSLKQAKKSVSKNGQEDYFLSEDFKSAVKSATKGTVSEYSIIDKSTNESGLVTVVVRATVAKLKLSASANRKRIAVFPLRVGNKSFRIGNNFADKNRVSRLLSQGISTNLVQSRKFTVLDREYISEQLAEKSNIINGDVKNEEMAKLGQELVADMILVGTIEDFGVETKTIRMQLSNRTITTQSAFVNFGYRILDVATKQIKFADVMELKLDPSELQAATGVSGQGALESAICRSASEVISVKILEAIYPIVVVSARGKYITLGQGGNNLQKGDKMEIFYYGDPILDPYTKESLGREEVPIGFVEVTRVNSKTSSASYIEGGFDISANFAPNKFLCRSISGDSKSENDIRIEEARSRFEERRQKRSSLLD
jgi:curli biogenesis system outer membrane secretion channel CsgG